MSDRKVKALVLLSGGLDSILAVRVLMEQGIEVTGINFESNFFSAEKARIAAEQLGIKLIVKDISGEILKLVKNPPSGLGKNMNPCVDCHALMMKMAGELIVGVPLAGAQSRVEPDNTKSPQPPLSRGSNKFDFLATGEVLGERPFSQNRNSLDKVIKIAGVEVLRPLSAKLLPETEAEKNKLVDREKLLDINGRSRERQFALAKKYGIKDYPAPAGGCLLTDPAFSTRLKGLLTNWPDANTDDAEIIKHGRVFWLNFNNINNKVNPPTPFAKGGSISKVLVVIGRDEKDNIALERVAKKGDFVLQLVGETGPLTVVRIKNYELRITNKINKELLLKIPKILDIKELKLDVLKEFDEIINIVSLLTGYYSTKARGREITIKIEKI